MAISCKVLDCNTTPGRESIRLTFPGRTGEVLTLALGTEEVQQFAVGATYGIAFELLEAPPAAKNATPTDPQPGNAE